MQDGFRLFLRGILEREADAGVRCRSVPCSFSRGCLAFQQQAAVAECCQPSLECCSEVQVVCIDRYFHYS